MKDLLKQGIYRVVSDLIKADKIIDKGEIEKLRQLTCSQENCRTCICRSSCKQRKHYAIDAENRQAAKVLTLASAIDKLSECNNVIRQDIIKWVESISVADGSCCREEALLLMAYKYCLKDETKGHCEIISVRCDKYDLEDSQVIYIEKQWEERLNKKISSNFRAISDSLKLGGFDFVYIPQIIDRYNKIQSETLSGFIKYLAPTLNDEEKNNVARRLTSMNTQYFYTSLLKNKLGISIKSDKPMLLIKISNNFVNEAKYANYLCVEVQDSIVRQVANFVDEFIKEQKLDSVTVKNLIDNEESFLYSGFYKTLFDLIVLTRGKRIKLIIKPKCRPMLYVEGLSNNTIPLSLQGKEAAFYVFSLCESLSGKYMERDLGNRFDNIYMYLSDRINVPNIRSATIIEPIISRIMSKFDENSDEKEKFFLCEDQLIKNQTHLIKPRKSDNNRRLYIDLDFDSIWVERGDNRIPLRESHIWEPYRESSEEEHTHQREKLRMYKEYRQFLGLDNPDITTKAIERNLKHMCGLTDQDLSSR